MMNPILPSAEEVAKEFCYQIEGALTNREMELVVQYNREIRNCGPCASHEFCDANELMTEALMALGVAIWHEEMPDNISELWDAAWAMAREADFDSTKVKGV